MKPFTSVIPSPLVGEGQGEGTRLPHAVTSAGGYTYTYDPNGNMVQGKNKTLEYDTENRIIKLTQTQTGSLTTFTYDGVLRRADACSG